MGDHAVLTASSEAQAQSRAVYATLGHGWYSTQHAAMTAAHATARATGHRMRVYPEYIEDHMYGWPVTFTRWHIGIGKGAL